MTTLQNKLLGERGEVNFVERSPHSQRRNDMLVTDDCRRNLLRLNLINHIGVTWIAIMKLKPLKLLVKSLGIL